jgi:SAM-dependent MidA family methyltransferase
MSIVKTKIGEGNMRVVNPIYEAIKTSALRRLSYADYMQLALYDERCGYYMRKKTKIGKEGDFFTNSHVSDVFGKLFASFFLRLVERQNVPPHICELGGGDGKFARAVLNEWKAKSPNTYGQLTYTMIETSPAQRVKQLQTLGDVAEKVKQYKDIKEFQQHVSSFSGIVFSNEFFDAFPVHVITKENGTVYELFVTVDDHKLVEEKYPLENEHIIQYLRERQLSLADGQRLEVPLALKTFLLETAPFFRHCVMFTIDYGYTDEELQLPARRQGSLRGYYRHHLITNPLMYPGEMDLTAHIQWDALRMYGKQAGWQYVSMLRQDRFLLAAGILLYLEEHDDSNPFSEKSRQNRAIRSLIMEMSTNFHVMIQQKGIRIRWDDIWVQPEFLSFA